MTSESSSLIRRLARWLSGVFEELSLSLDRFGHTDGATRLREQAAAALLAYEELVENANDIIYSNDLEGNFTSLNRAGEQISGYTREEAARMNLLQVVAPAYQETVRQMIQRRFADENKGAYQLEVLAKEGRRVVLEVSTRLILKEGRPVGVQGIARDVTQRKHLEAQLVQAQKMEAIGHLAGGVAHDFNNLLTAVTGYSDLVLKRLGPESPVRQEIEQIKKAGQRATTLTRQLLAFSRKQMLQPRVLDLNAVLSDVERLLRRLIGENIRLSMVLGSDLGRVKADPGQIEQIIMNLDVQPGRYVMLAVSDTGIGMTANTRHRIFEPFFTTKAKGKGTGMGLSTVYGIVKQSGGNIWVYSEPNQGSTFKVYLPRVDAPLDLYEALGSETEIPRGTETILLVEDEEAVRSLICKVLSTLGYAVLECSQPEDALRVAREHPETIHLLLTDVIMPQMSGRDVANQVGLLRPTTKVLFMSGYTDDAIGRHGVLDPGIAFLQKPFSPDSLARKVREVLDGN